MSSFRSIAEATPAQWAAIQAAQERRHGREYAWCLRLLRACRHISDEFAVDQLTHCLQVASRAERAGADDGLVLVGLLHDCGKPLSLTGHPEVAAGMLREYLPAGAYNVLLHHGEFLADETHGTSRREAFTAEPWYADAVAFAGWDAASFDPAYPALPLAHFLPRLRRLYRLA